MDIDGIKTTEVNDVAALRGVPLNASGVGLPFAPIDWPNPGDNWRWRVGKRVGANGFHRDRYLSTPLSFGGNDAKKGYFPSRPSVVQYLQNEFPGADVDAFFSSFTWRIPSAQGGGSHYAKEMEGRQLDSVSDSDSDPGTVRCKGRNKNCLSLNKEWIETKPSPMPCDLCCNEEDFCRDCCCILCYKPVDSSYGSYSYIKCEAKESEYFICAHMAHLNCALRIYLAGTVGGTIRLDAQYHCRRCNARTDLVPHITRSVEVCQNIRDSRDDIDKILTVGICILRNSERAIAKRLLSRIELAYSKLQSGISIENIWEVEDTIGGISTGSEQTKPAISESEIRPRDLEVEIYSVLEALRKSQEAEYKVAEEVLNSQKTYLVTLFQQLEKERSELTTRTSSVGTDELLEPVLNQMNQIKRELAKFKDMEQVANGFGKTSEGILKQHFRIHID